MSLSDTVLQNSQDPERLEIVLLEEGHVAITLSSASYEEGGRGHFTQRTSTSCWCTYLEKGKSDSYILQMRTDESAETAVGEGEIRMQSQLESYSAFLPYGVTRFHAWQISSDSDNICVGLLM